MKNNNIERVVCWFSCGVTSAVAAKLAIQKYIDTYPIEVVFIDTGSEHEDNFRFMRDIAAWLQTDIKTIRDERYKNTLDVYRKDKYLVGSVGARCSLVLKKRVRQKYENLGIDLQIFGYGAEEQNRADRFAENNPLVNCEFPLIDKRLTKKDCHAILASVGIARPITYNLGFNNANCLNTGCVKGGMGYWNHYRKHFPVQFQEMAKVERELGVSILREGSGKNSSSVYLDELEPSRGRHDTEPPIQCGLFCGNEIL